MKNQANWDFAQKKSPFILTKFLAIFLIISLLKSLFFNDTQKQLLINLFMTVAIIVISLIIRTLKVEQEIKKFEKQNENG